MPPAYKGTERYFLKTMDFLAKVILEVEVLIFIFVNTEYVFKISEPQFLICKT